MLITYNLENNAYDSVQKGGAGGKKEWEVWEVAVSEVQSMHQLWSGY